MKLFLKQVAVPPPRGKGGQVPNHSGTARATQLESIRHSRLNSPFISNITGTLTLNTQTQPEFLF